jgi:L-ascorbate metabolism protein UlaG (beta-lactamase superfamily)
VIKPELQGEALLADVRRAPADDLHLWWLGQSGFLIRLQNHAVLVDPYLSDSLTAKYSTTETSHVRISERVIDPAMLSFVDVVATTHSHTDHLDGETLCAIKPKQIIAPRGALPQVRERVPHATPVLMSPGTTHLHDRVVITAVPAVHGALEAVGFVFQFDSWVVYHSGDTTSFDGSELRQFDIDIAILPINGKLNNMNGREAAQLANAIGAKIVIPCHYDMFEFNTADPYEQFVPECERIGQAYRVLKLGERFTYPEAS